MCTRASPPGEELKHGAITPQRTPLLRTSYSNLRHHPPMEAPFCSTGPRLLRSGEGRALSASGTVAPNGPAVATQAAATQKFTLVFFFFPPPLCCRTGKSVRMRVRAPSFDCLLSPPNKKVEKKVTLAKVLQSVSYLTWALSQHALCASLGVFVCECV